MWGRTWPLMAVVMPIWMHTLLSLNIALSVLMSWPWLLGLWAITSLFLAAMFALTFEDKYGNVEELDDHNWRHCSGICSNPDL